jgi:hypothetical protein
VLTRARQRAPVLTRARAQPWTLLAAALLLVAAVVLGGGQGRARAAPVDFGPENEQWQGTSTLWETARALGFGVEVRTRLEWNALEPNEILFFLYPTRPIPYEKLVRFLQAGGRVIIADDFGQSAPVLERLGVRRVPVQGHAVARLFAENPNLPLATPGVTHPLNTGIPELVTNHPSAFDTELPAIYRFEPRGGAVVVAATLKRGRVVLLSDPSILINRMLEFPGNAAFARRLLGYLGRGGEDRYVVLVQGFEEAGTPKAAVSVTGPPPKGISAILAHANELLRTFNEYLLDRIWIMPLATLLAGLLLAVAVWIIPLMRPRYDASWTRPGEGPPRARYERDLRPYLEGRGRKLNYIYPAAVLRDVLDVDLEEALGVAAPLLTMDEHALRKLARKRGGAEAEADCARLVQLCRRVPAREQVSPYTLTPRFGQRDLERLRRVGTRLRQRLRPDDPGAGRSGGPGASAGPDPSNPEPPSRG